MKTTPTSLAITIAIIACFVGLGVGIGIGHREGVKDKDREVQRLTKEIRTRVNAHAEFVTLQYGELEKNALILSDKARGATALADELDRKLRLAENKVIRYREELEELKSQLDKFQSQKELP